MKNIINYLLMSIQLLAMDNKHYSYWLILIIISGMLYIIFGTIFVVFGFRGFLVIAGISFIVSLLYGLLYSISHESHN
jgi:hypothetical protein